MAVIKNKNPRFPPETESPTFDEPLSGYKLQVGDMIWGKVKSHPWWPGHIFTQSLAEPSLRRSKRDNHVLVAFFGDNSYGYFNPADLVPFLPNFAEKSRQTNSRTFQKAVEESIDEASKRSALGLACRCRNPDNFRPVDVKGYFEVEIDEVKTVYSSKQIGKARDGFSSRRFVEFVGDLALGPTDSEHSGIGFVMSMAAVLAYRKAVFEEFDDTYNEAFGDQQSPRSRKSRKDGAQRLKEISRAPLSGPLVIAEPLGKGKGSVKVNNKPKELGKKDRDVSKERDESDESKAAAPLATEACDYVVQERGPAVSVKPRMSVKLKQRGTVLSQNVTNRKNPLAAVSRFSSHLFESRSSLDKGNDNLLENKNLVSSDVTAGRISRDGFAEMTDLKDDYITFTDSKLVEQSQSQPVIDKLHEQEQFQVVDTKLNIEFSKMHTDTEDANKANIHKLPGGDSSASQNSGLLNKKRKKESMRSDDNGTVSLNKKKRLKELLRSDDNGTQIHAYPLESRGGALMAKVIGKPVQVVTATDDFQKKDDRVIASFLPDSSPVDLELSKIVTDLKTFAIDHFHGVNISSTVARFFFLKFRSIVYQKSLVIPASASVEMQHSVKPEKPTMPNDLTTEGEWKRRPSDRQEEMAVKKKKKVNDLKLLASEKKPSFQPKKTTIPDAPPQAAVKQQRTEEPVKKGDVQVLISQTHVSTAPSESSVKEMRQPLKPEKPTRPDDLTTQGERKNGPSDRQKEIAATKKKVNDPKLLASEKKPSFQPKKTIIPDAPPPAVKQPTIPVEPVKNKEVPTMLVMRFPSGGTLPSLNELKARFGYFGHLDHSGTQISWKTSSCRVVYRHKLHAQAAYKYAMSARNLFGNTNVRCYTREVEPESGKVEEKKPPPSTESQPPGVQLKSILKTSVALDNDTGLVGGDRGVGVPRVKFMLNKEESSRGVQFTNKNLNKNANFAASSSTSSRIEYINKNTQKVNVAPPQPPLPIFSNRVATNLKVHTKRPPPQPEIDISREMMTLLKRCNEVVTNVTSLLGYKPYHPL